jgi:hypothetical protein
MGHLAAGARNLRFSARQGRFSPSLNGADAAPLKIPIGIVVSTAKCHRAVGELLDDFFQP